MMTTTIHKLVALFIISITLFSCGNDEDKGSNNSQPSSVNVSSSNGQLRISWENQNAARYLVYYGEENARPTIVETRSNEVTIDRPESSNIIITVEAYDDLGNSTFFRPQEVQL